MKLIKGFEVISEKDNRKDSNASEVIKWGFYGDVEADNKIIEFSWHSNCIKANFSNCTWDFIPGLNHILVLIGKHADNNFISPNDFCNLLINDDFQDFTKDTLLSEMENDINREKNMRLPTRSSYGGILTYYKDLEVGAKFYVKNGCWHGEVIEENGIKKIKIRETGDIHEAGDNYAWI